MMDIKNIVTLVIYNDKQQILVQDRKTYSKYWEEWSFFWGSVEKWETALQAAKREAKEELNIEINDDMIIHIWNTKHSIPERDQEYNRTLFAIKTDKTQNEFTDLEWAGAYFFAIEKVETLKMTTKIDKEIEIIKKYFWS